MGLRLRAGNCPVHSSHCAPSKTCFALQAAFAALRWYVGLGHTTAQRRLATPGFAASAAAAGGTIVQQFPEILVPFLLQVTKSSTLWVQEFKWHMHSFAKSGQSFRVLIFSAVHCISLLLVFNALSPKVSFCKWKLVQTRSPRSRRQIWHRCNVQSNMHCLHMACWVADHLHERPDH